MSDAYRPSLSPSGGFIVRTGCSVSASISDVAPPPSRDPGTQPVAGRENQKQDSSVHKHRVFSTRRAKSSFQKIRRRARNLTSRRRPVSNWSLQYPVSCLMHHPCHTAVTASNSGSHSRPFKQRPEIGTVASRKSLGGEFWLKVRQANFVTPLGGVNHHGCEHLKSMRSPSHRAQVITTQAGPSPPGLWGLGKAGTVSSLTVMRTEAKPAS